MLDPSSQGRVDIQYFNAAQIKKPWWRLVHRICDGLYDDTEVLFEWLYRGRAITDFTGAQDDISVSSLSDFESFTNGAILFF